jgi:PKD repeat protein
MLFLSRGFRCSWRISFIFFALALFWASPGLALEQTLSLLPSTVTVDPTDTFTITFNYNADDPNSTGLGAEIYYDDSIINFDSSNVLFSTGQSTAPTDQEDTADGDGDAATTRKITFGYFDLNGNWPGTVPVDLFEVTFQAVGAGTKAFNIVTTSTPAGATFVPNTSTVTVNAPADSEAPAVTNVLANGASPATVTAGDTVTLTATIDDTGLGDSNITAAEYYVGTATDDPGEGSGAAMAVVSGSFDDAVSEDVTADISSALQSAGNFTFNVRGQDAAGNWSATQSVDVTVEPDAVDHIRLEVTKNTIATDGVDTVDVTGTWVDQFDNPVPSETTDISFIATDTTYASFTGDVPNITVTPNSGVAVATLTGKDVDAAGAPTFDVSATGGGFNSIPATIAIQPTDNILETITIEIVPGGDVESTTPGVGQTVQFNASGVFDDASTEDPLGGVAWNAASGTGDGSINAMGLFSADAEGTVDITASRDGVTSNPITLNVQPPPPLVVNAANLPAQIAFDETLDFGAAVSGGVPPYNFSIDPASPAAGAIDGAGVFSIPNANSAFAGAYTLIVEDSAGTQETYTVTVPMALSPSFGTFKEGEAATPFSILGVPGDVTEFTVALSPSTDVGAFTDPITVASPETTFDYTPPALSDAVTQTQNFTATFTATGSSLPTELTTLQGSYSMVALISYAAKVTDGTDPIDAVSVTPLFDVTKATTTDANGDFSIPDIENTGATYEFSFSKTGFVPKTLALSAADIVAGADVILDPIGTVGGTLQGTVTDAGTANALANAAITVSADGDPITNGGGMPITVYSDNAGAYTFEIPDAFAAAANFEITASKTGYLDRTINETGPGAAPVNITNADLGLSAVSIIRPSGNVAGDDLFLNINAEPTNFNGTATEIQVLDLFNGNADVTGEFTINGSTWLSQLVGYEPENAALKYEITADTADDRDIGTKPSPPAITKRVFSYVNRQSLPTNAVINNPNTAGGSVTANEVIPTATPTAAQGTEVTIPAGGLLGSVRDSVTLSVVEAVPSVAHPQSILNAGTDIAKGPVFAQVQMFDENRVLVNDAEIDRLIIRMKYDTTIPSEKLADLLIAADTLADMVNGNVFPAIGAPWNAKILDVSGGFVTFEVAALSAFGIAGVDQVVGVAPTISSISPSSNVGTAGGELITLTGSGFATATDLLIDGASFAGTWTIVSDSTITFEAPGGTAGNSRSVRVVNPSGTSNTVSFQYAGGIVPPPPTPIPVPDVDFEVIGFEDEEVVEVPLGAELEFNDLTTGQGLFRWEWDFNFDDTDAGEDFESSERNPVFTYEEPGTYTIRLLVTGSGGIGRETKEDFVVVTEVVDPPAAAIEVSPAASGEAPFEVTFSDASTGGAVETRTWTIDGVEVGEGAESFTETFETPGTFNVELTVENAMGSDSAAQTITVTEIGEINADFSFQVAADGLTVSFTDLSEPEALVSFRVWDFGDDSAPSNDVNPTHTYGSAGTYEVTLSVLGPDNNTFSATKTVVVPGSGGEINAAFNATPTSGTVPLTVSFTDQSTATNGITLWQWDFDNDGEVDSTNNPQPTFVYNDAGTFTATLTVTGPDGTDTATQSITVDPVPPEDVINPPEGQQPANGATDVSLNPTLMIGPFDDPDSQYGATQWQIAIDPSFAEMFLIWDQIKGEGTDDDFMLEIPDFILENGPATYYWRARFIDANGEFSRWSDIYTFSTIATEPEDADDDGVDDGEEVDDPLSVFPGLDPNNPLVLYVRAAEGDGFWALEGVENVADLIRLKAYTVGEAGVGLPPNTTMPLGLIGYKLQTLNAGDEAKVRVHFNPAAAANSAWFAFLGVEGWQEFSGSTAVFGDGMASVMLTLQDGGFGDLDGIENGIIIVPLSGFGVVEAEIVDGGSGSDTCFISAATEKPWAAAVLMTLVAAAALAIRRSPIR